MSYNSSWTGKADQRFLWALHVHMLGTIGFGILVYSLPPGTGPRMLINVAATTAACLLSYRLPVRHAIIGVLLNGRRQVQPASRRRPTRRSLAARRCFPRRIGN